MFSVVARVRAGYRSDRWRASDDSQRASKPAQTSPIRELRQCAVAASTLERERADSASDVGATIKHAERLPAKRRATGGRHAPCHLLKASEEKISTTTIPTLVV
jgi:hypothetical protein